MLSLLLPQNIHIPKYCILPEVNTKFRKIQESPGYGCYTSLVTRLSEAVVIWHGRRTHRLCDVTLLATAQQNQNKERSKIILDESKVLLNSGNKTNMAENKKNSFHGRER